MSLGVNILLDPLHLGSTLIIPFTWFKTTLNYRMMVERYSNLKEEVGSSNPGYEISSLHDGKLAMWSTASCTLAFACRPFVSKGKCTYIPFTARGINSQTHAFFIQISKLVRAEIITK